MDDRFWFFHCHEDDQQANNGHNQRLCQHLFNANVLSYRACDCWSNGSTTINGLRPNLSDNAGNMTVPVKLPKPKPIIIWLILSSDRCK